MAYYNTCPWCGASLDPGESCDCKKNPMQPELTSEKEITSSIFYHKNNNKSRGVL